MKDKLDEFAALAMQGYLINSDHFESVMRVAGEPNEVHRMIAEAAYDLAEAMVTEGEKRKAKRE